MWKDYYNQYVRPTFVDNISKLGIDVSFDRAQGHYLYSGSTESLDLVGGYGSTFLGHNPPELIEHAKQLLDAQVAHHAQRSVRVGAAKLAKRLNQIFEKAFGEEYVFQFANSGAEAIEIAIKHAAFVFQLHYDERVKQYELDKDKLSKTMLAHNQKVLDMPYQFVCLRGGFHGKTNAALSVSYEDSIKPALPVYHSHLFIRPNEMSGAIELLREAREFLYEINSKGEVIKRAYWPIMGVIAEPIIGDGGIIPLHKEFMVALRDLSGKMDVPLIFDEIQCGLGKTGYMIASAEHEVAADYYTFSKSLGGGLAKSAVTAINKKVFLDKVALVHSSTYNEDDFSCELALKFLEIVERDNLCQLAIDNGDKLYSLLEKIKVDYPGIIKFIRGKGLMLGIVFEPELQYPKQFANLALFIESYLFTEQRVRIATTIGQANVIRLEPAANLSEKEFKHINQAIRQLCQQFTKLQ